MNKISYYLFLIVGIATCLSFIPHCFMGYPQVLQHISNGEIKGNAVDGMKIIWLYSSITMLLLGIWMLFLAKPVKKGNHHARLQGLFIAIGLIIFGLITAYIKKEVFNHLFFFTIQGILLLLSVTVFYKHKSNE